MVLAVLNAVAAAPAAASTAVAPFGGTAPSVPATVSSVTCRTQCASFTTARPGSSVRVLGSSMSEVAQVVFLGGRGSADDVSAPASAVEEGRVDAVVPTGARSGRVQVLNADGAASRATRQALRISRSAADSGLAARVAQRRVLFDGTAPATLDLYGGRAADAGVSVDLLHQPDGAVVAHW